MTLPATCLLRHLRNGLSAMSRRAAAVVLWTGAVALPLFAFAQHPASPPAAPSRLSGELFYQLLLGELNLRQGAPEVGFSLLLDAARKTKEEALFSHTLDVALKARYGDGALAAASEWTKAYPQDRRANNQLLQILIALGRIGETAEPLRKEVSLTPSADRNQTLALVARQYARASDKKLAAEVVERALSPFLEDRTTAAAAWSSVGRLRLQQGDRAGALQAAQQGLQAEPASIYPALLALELVNQNVADAEPVLQQALTRQTKPDLAMAYVRLLVEQQRYDPAQSVLEALTRTYPDYAEGWLVLGSMQFERGQESQAETALARYVQLVTKEPTAATSKGLLQAQSRRAEILAKRGQIDQGRQLIANLPSTNEDEQLSKLLTEAQLLRDHQQWQAAYDLLDRANRSESDVRYEQAMLAEKLGKFADMERILRQIIAADPSYYNAYNALGFSLADRGQRLAEAKQLIVKALALAPDDPFITDSLGWVEFRLGNLPAALLHLKKAYDTRQDAEIAAHLGEVLWVLSRQEEALRIWREGLKLAPDNSTLKETLQRLKPAL